MSDPDPDERLRRLEERIEAVKKAQKPPPRAATEGISQAGLAWQMIVELVTGLAIGFGIGFGLDWVFGTRPLFLVLFVLLGFGAGVNVMLGTARKVQKEAKAVKPADDEGT